MGVSLMATSAVPSKTVSVPPASLTSAMIFSVVDEDPECAVNTTWALVWAAMADRVEVSTEVVVTPTADAVVSKAIETTGTTRPSAITLPKRRARRLRQKSMCPT
jgi:hypothetical protein